MRQGLAMGRASSVLLFCVAIDPLICALNRVPAVRTLKAYMDDNATEGQGSTWIASSQERFEALRTAGFQVLGHPAPSRCGRPVYQLTQHSAFLPCRKMSTLRPLSVGVSN